MQSVASKPHGGNREAAQSIGKSQDNSKKSTVDKKSEREKKRADKANKNKVKEEEDRKKAIEDKWAKIRVDYKDPYQLSEGEIMIVIEHSDDPGRVLMSTSHDYEKYKRIASKIRQWIMRDFPSMKVIIKPNNHQKSNERIGCFEISYFHMKDGQLQRQDIFSKILERKWPKWKNIQEMIKKFVKNSHLTVTIKDISREKKNQFENMVLYVKNVLFAKNSGVSGATTKSLMGSDLHRSQELKQSGVSQSTQTTQPAPQTLTDFKQQVSSESGVVQFEFLPVGNYAIVFNGNRTYRPVNIPFQVSANEPEIHITVEVDLVEEGYFSLEIDLNDIKNRKGEIEESIGNLNPKSQKAQIDEITKERKSLDEHEKSIRRYKISLVRSDDSRKENDPCIPIPCVKTTLNDDSNPIYECMVEPSHYDIILTNGTEQTTLKKKLSLTRGENRLFLDPKNMNVEPQSSRKPAREGNTSARGQGQSPQGNNTTPQGAGNTQNKAGATGTAKQTGKDGVDVGKNRPDTTGSIWSEVDDSHRAGSADTRNRPGSASIMNKTQDMSHAHIHQAQSHQVINEEPAENEDEKFMVKMLVDQGELPFEMFFLYEDEDGVVHLITRDEPPTESGYFQADKLKEVLALDDVRQREGYYRMLIRRNPDVKQFNPVHIMVNCSGTSYARKISKDPFSPTAHEEQFLDFGVFKFPDNSYMPIGVLSSEPILSPTYMLPQIRSLIGKLSDSKLGIDKIFGFGGKTERVDGEECLPIKEVKRSLENCMIPISDHILQAFKLHPGQEFISLKRLTDTVESWRQNINVLDEVNEEDDGEEEEENGNDDEYQNFDEDEFAEPDQNN